MSNDNTSVVMIERAAEQLRQERETFDQAKKHDSLWFILKLIMGFVSVLLLICVMIVTVYILFNAIDFSLAVTNLAGAALFVDVLGMLIGVWKIVIAPDSSSKLQPTTQVSSPTPTE